MIDAKYWSLIYFYSIPPSPEEELININKYKQNKAFLSIQKTVITLKHPYLQIL